MKKIRSVERNYCSKCTTVNNERLLSALVKCNIDKLQYRREERVAGENSQGLVPSKGHGKLLLILAFNDFEIHKGSLILATPRSDLVLDGPV